MGTWFPITTSVSPLPYFFSSHVVLRPPWQKKRKSRIHVCFFLFLFLSCALLFSCCCHYWKHPPSNDYCVFLLFFVCISLLLYFLVRMCLNFFGVFFFLMKKNQETDSRKVTERKREILWKFHCKLSRWQYVCVCYLNKKNSKTVALHFFLFLKKVWGAKKNLWN